jgi:hypothetical protein
MDESAAGFSMTLPQEEVTAGDFAHRSQIKKKIEPLIFTNKK